MTSRPSGSPPPTTDEFYIGYAPPMPARTAARVARVVAAVLAVSMIAALTAVAAHRRLAPAAFDYGRPQELRGELLRTPYPELSIDGRRSLLVGRGKHGAESALAGVPDGPVTLGGTRIERGGRRMFEVVPGSARAERVVPAHGTESVPSVSSVPDLATRDSAAAGDSPTGRSQPRPDVADSAITTLRGEIVDSKCFLGVMNPGEGTVHRDCARVCLRGGIPPMLLVRGARAEEALVLLVDDSGAPIGRQIADLAGVPVEVRGRLTRAGDRLVLATARAQVVPLAR